jgi:two-component system chemotaxis sensor kinase CheA
LMPVLGRFPRMVREMAMALGKDVDLRVAGSGIDVDKSIADALVDPLTHLIRNALDHGIERPDVRRLAGKPSRAAIELTISREGDQLLVALRDDGRGIDAATIRRVALDRGLLDEAALAALDDEAAVNLVFQPGFSTAERVTDISGRGVGMDAVRATISGLGGRVSLSSSPGHGTTVHLTLPMNSVLTGIVLISCAGERYGVPLEAIVEAARVPIDQIFPVRSGRAFILRDRTLPLIDLHELLGAAPQNRERDEARVLIVRVGSERVALGVDAILDRRELSLRPMPRLLSGMRGISGTALLGDGEMVLVLDPEELIG